MSKKLNHPKELTQWLQKFVNEEYENNEIIFDRCSEMFEIIVSELDKHDLHLAVENKILMIKLCKFFYENSYV